ncbi:DUF6207 family protein [Streptomyces sp. NPDC085929]|uniref:DUF6207 family protein n=1 Tax=Streptomyces sp. NPDC085929 TaxID=3365739 RepID=UPI0037D953F6
MKPINEQHITEPGLVVLDITGGDEDTVRAVMAASEERWATSGIGPVRRDPGEPGVRARMYADVTVRGATSYRGLRFLVFMDDGGDAEAEPRSSPRHDHRV